MNKKTNNIIAIVIIIVLTICLAFTIVDNNETKTEVVNFDMPNTSRRGNVPYQGNRFNLPKDNKVDQLEDFNKNKEDTTVDSEDKEDKNDSCNCQEIRPSIKNRDNEIRSIPTINKTSDNSLKTVLIVAESLLLGATVMFLIMNNIEKEEKKEKRVK